MEVPLKIPVADFRARNKESFSRKNNKRIVKPKPYTPQAQIKALPKLMEKECAFWGLLLYSPSSQAKSDSYVFPGAPGNPVIKGKSSNPLSSKKRQK